MPKIKIGTRDIAKALVGNKEVKGIYYGTTLVYAKKFTITFNEIGDTYNLGSWSKSTIQCPYGGTLTRSSDTITVKDIFGNTVDTSTYSISSGGGQYSSTVTYTNATSAFVSDAITVTANVNTVIVGFTISLLTNITNPQYGTASWDTSTISVTSGSLVEISSNYKTLYFYKSDAITLIGTRTLTTTPEPWCTTTISYQYNIQGSQEWNTLTTGTIFVGDTTIRANVVFGTFNWNPYINVTTANASYNDIEVALDAAYSSGTALFMHCVDSVHNNWYLDMIGNGDLEFNCDLDQCVDGWTSIDEVDDDYNYVYSLITSSESYVYLYIPSGNDDSVWYLYYKNV